MSQGCDFLPLKRVLELIGVSRSTLWRVSGSGMDGFPRPQVRGRRLFWRQQEIPAISRCIEAFEGRNVFDRKKKNERRRRETQHAALAELKHTKVRGRRSRTAERSQHRVICLAYSRVEQSPCRRRRLRTSSRSRCAAPIWASSSQWMSERSAFIRSCHRRPFAAMGATPWFALSQENAMSGPRIRAATLFIVIAIAAAACGIPPAAEAPAEAAAGEIRSGYAEVGDLRMYYEIQGSGRPLVLLHGGAATIDYSFAGMRPALTQGWTTIAVEQQAHGHTADVERPLRFEQMADDTAAALRQLDIENADVFGWSDGGNVALAIRHPDLVRKVAIFGTNASNEGLRPEVWALIQQAAALGEAAGDGETPPGLREAQDRAAPARDSWPNLVAKVMEQAVAFEGWSPAQLRAIRAPVLVMIGDSDIVRPEHAVEMYQLMPNAELAVLPGVDHFGPVSDAPQVTTLVTAFLETPMPNAAAARGHADPLIRCPAHQCLLCAALVVVGGGGGRLRRLPLKCNAMNVAPNATMAPRGMRIAAFSPLLELYLSWIWTIIQTRAFGA